MVEAAVKGAAKVEVEAAKVMALEAAVEPMVWNTGDRGKSKSKSKSKGMWDRGNNRGGSRGGGDRDIRGGDRGSN